MFRRLGIPLHDADAAVHRCWARRAAVRGRAGVSGVVADGAVDRRALAPGPPARSAALKRCWNPSSTRWSRADSATSCAPAGRCGPGWWCRYPAAVLRDRATSCDATWSSPRRNFSKTSGFVAAQYEPRPSGPDRESPADARCRETPPRRFRGADRARSTADAWSF